MIVHSIIPPPHAPVTRVWGARTDDYFYALDISVRQLGCEAVPEWWPFTFLGSGPLRLRELWKQVTVIAGQRGYRVERGTRRELTVEEWAALDAAGEAHALALVRGT